MQSQKLTGVGKLGQIQNMNSIVDSIWPVRPDNAKELINNVPFHEFFRNFRIQERKVGWNTM